MSEWTIFSTLHGLWVLPLKKRFFVLLHDAIIFTKVGRFMKLWKASNHILLLKDYKSLKIQVAMLKENILNFNLIWFSCWLCTQNLFIAFACLELHSRRPVKIVISIMSFTVRSRRPTPLVNVVVTLNHHNRNKGSVDPINGY